MPDKSNKPAPVAAKPAVVAAKPVAAPTTTPPRHDPVPVTTVGAKPPVATAPKSSAATAPKAVEARKRGRPLGAKNVPKPVLGKAVAAKPAAAVATKPAAVVAKPVIPKPTKIPTKPAAPHAAATPSEGYKPMTDTITKIQDAAKTFSGDASARTQAMFGDFSGRAKGAYEKSVKMTEEMTAFQKGNVEAIVESSKLAAKAAETLGQNAADYARKSFETGTAAFKTFASAKSPTELFKLQSDYLKSYFDSAVAEGTKVTESWLKLAGDVAQPLSNRVAVAVEKVKATAAI